MVRAESKYGRNDTVSFYVVRLWPLLIFVVAQLVPAYCSSKVSKPGVDGILLPETGYGDLLDWFDTHDAADNVSETEVDADKEEFPQIVTGCGDGVCQGAETPENCAKDCLKTTKVAVFIFAHKGDELGALGRIRDLILAGAKVYVFYITFDDTPLEQYYDGSKAKTAPASLGVVEENIYCYENYIEWGLVTGSNEILERLKQHLAQIQPDEVYLPQLCGGELEHELAHAAGFWGTKRAKLSPQFYEVPAPSNFYILQPPDLTIAADSPDVFVEQFIQRWKMLPKATEELKPTLNTQDMMAIRLAAAHIADEWWQQVVLTLPEDRLLYMLSLLQRFRKVPTDQKPQDRPYVSSLANPEGVYIYEEQGYSFDDYKAYERLMRSFSGVNARTVPSHLPWFDEPMEVIIAHPFEINVELWSFSGAMDTIEFLIGIGPSKKETEDCQTPESLQILPNEKKQIKIQCKAMEPIGEHVYYIRAYSALAKQNAEAAKFAQVPFVIKVYQ